MHSDPATNTRPALPRCKRFRAWWLVGIALVAVAGCGSASQRVSTDPKAAHDQVYLGDFDGDGVEDRLYYTSDPTDDLLSTAHGNFVMSFPTGAIPKIGDFDGDGVDDVLFFTAGSADQRVWYFGASTGTPRYEKVRYLATGDTPIVGNFDGQPGDEIVWFGSGSTNTSVWSFNSLRGVRIQGVGRASEQRVLADHVRGEGPERTTSVRRQPLRTTTNLPTARGARSQRAALRTTGR